MSITWRSRFIKVKCKKCGNVQITFSHATIKVRCNQCNEILTIPHGGKAKILADIVEVVDVKPTQ
ncbi:MAG: 30S ribosomal protein S27e [Candidatus Geothermarchaeota archaeon]